MLTALPTKYGAGISICGDYFDLVGLRETINDLVHDNASTPHFEFAQALAYDIRHAYQGDREKRSFETSHGKIDYYSVNVLWPTFLVQVALIRSAAAYLPTSKEQQAHLFLLEHCASTALSILDPAVAKVCADWFSSPMHIPEDFLIDFVDYQSRVYITSASTAKKRICLLPYIMGQINKYSPEYKAYEEESNLIAKQQGCRPQDLHDLSEWPPFKW